ncbi:MAG: peptidase U32 family protein [Intestinimonas sp.]
MLELLAPAGSPEAVTAAVQAGADAVYLGYGDFNARRNAKNFSLEELAAAVSYCHVRGAKVFLTLNTLVSDRELPAAARTAAEAAEAGWTRCSSRTWGSCGCSARWLPALPSTGPHS